MSCLHLDVLCSVDIARMSPTINVFPNKYHDPRHLSVYLVFMNWMRQVSFPIISTLEDEGAHGDEDQPENQGLF